MATVRAPYPSRMKEIDEASLASMTRTDTDATFKNRGGDVVGEMTIRNPRSSFVKAIKRIGSYDYGYRDVLIKNWQAPFSNNSNLPDETYPVMPNDVTFSPDGNYLAVAHTSNLFYFVDVFKKQDSDNFQILTVLITASQANGVSFSNDGRYLAIAHAGSPYITIYKRSRDTFTKISDPDVLPAFTGRNVSWAKDDRYLAIAHVNSPFLTIYKRSGDLFSKIPNLVDGPTSNYVTNVSFSLDGGFLALSLSVSPYLIVYSVEGDTFTKISTINILPTSYCSAVEFSPDGAFLAVTHSGSPYITIYSRNGNVFTKLPPPNVLPSWIASDLSWSPDSRYLSVLHETSPVVTIYEKNEDEFRVILPPENIPEWDPQNGGIDFSPDGKYLAILYGYDNSEDEMHPTLRIFKSDLPPLKGPAIRMDEVT